jgi:hypothetical protein
MMSSSKAKQINPKNDRASSRNDHKSKISPFAISPPTHQLGLIDSDDVDTSRSWDEV